MRTPSGRRLRTGVAAALLALVAVPAAPGQAAAASGRCAPGTGVTVVVDYGPLGGGVVIGCDPDGAGKPASQVVTAAGFSLDYVSSQPGFVCRVNGQPGEAEEDCGDTPPADAYWGLFWSDADPATWAYSSEGAGSLDVPEGGSIGWRFQDGGTRENPSEPPTAAKKAPSPEPSKSPSPQPSEPPKAAPTPTPTPSASVPPGTQGSDQTPGGQANPEGPDEQPSDQGVDGGSGAGKGDDKGRKGEGKGNDDKSRKPPRDKAHPEQAASPSASPTVVAVAPASDEPLDDEGSSTTLPLVAGAAVVLLAGAAGVITWRRRS